MTYTTKFIRVADFLSKVDFSKEIDDSSGMFKNTCIKAALTAIKNNYLITVPAFYNEKGMLSIVNTSELLNHVLVLYFPEIMELKNMDRVLIDTVQRLEQKVISSDLIKADKLLLTKEYLKNLGASEEEIEQSINKLADNFSEYNVQFIIYQNEDIAYTARHVLNTR